MRAGGGAVYVKRAGGSEQIFVARLPTAPGSQPVRVHGGVARPAPPQPVIAAADRDRLAVAWVSGGSALHRRAPGWTPPASRPRG